MRTQNKLNDQISIDQSRLLGKGSTGNVYLGFNNINPYIKYAIKAIDLNQINNQVTRYLLSCQIVALTNISKNDSKHIVKLKQVILSKGYCYLVMQLLQGGPLSQFIKENPNGIDQFCAIDILNQLIDAFKQIKRHGIIHRDIKPDNIIFKQQRNSNLNQNNCNSKIPSFHPQYNVALIDFGYCTVQNVPNKPQVYYNVGSPKYMSPQAYKTNFYSEKSDIWALGIILYQMLHGKTFDTGMQMDQYLNFIQTKGIPFKAELNEDVKGLLKGMLFYDCGNRFNLQQTFQNVQKIINRFKNKDVNLNNARYSPSKRHISQQKVYFQNSKPIKINLMQSMILNNPNQQLAFKPQMLNNQNPMYRRDQRFVRVLQKFPQQNIQGRKIIHLQKTQYLQVPMEKQEKIPEQKFIKNENNHFQADNQLKFKNVIYKSQIAQMTQRNFNNSQKKNVFFNSQVTNFLRPSSFAQETNQTPFKHPQIQKQNLFIKQNKNLQKSYSTNNVEFIHNNTNFVNPSTCKNKQYQIKIKQINPINQNQLVLRNTMPHFARYPQQPQHPQQNLRKIIKMNQKPYQFQNINAHKNINTDKRNPFISHFSSPFSIIKAPIQAKIETNLIRNGQQNQARFQKKYQNLNYPISNKIVNQNIQERLYLQNKQKRNSYGQNIIVQERPNQISNNLQFNPVYIQQNNIRKNNVMENNKSLILQLNSRYPIQNNFHQNNNLTFNKMYQNNPRSTNNYINTKMIEVNKNYFNPAFQQKINLNHPIENRNTIHFRQGEFPIHQTVSYQIRQPINLQQRNF